ncbi:dihydroxyacetone kinase phosphoryl donor subunit DhaM [Subtercola endophyticus]|uniref:dihydroxyacetone kinase phosphoryl donor subunit DhaM n=1 Tax=Subtercola endophyticus TaxID=2895559 RepID=UPI001E48E61D|nr:dihydroxyacetone kinase phosphoryl donor subunit DhaM [Subtercola endophyticus]UFS60447.1 PTS-dependent dihydroxyacetone kinase phosphotransferase subunit DhaM [Subtercola endophyticus]
MPGTDGKVGLVFVSHSPKIAEGLVDLASQMAPATSLAAAGGTDEGGIGTSFDKVSAAIGEVDSGVGVVVLADLGSAILTAETALDFLDDDVQARVRIVDAPLVEGAVAASVTAETGGSLAEVVAAAETARGASGAVPGPDAAAAPADDDALRRTVTIVNKDGLHARPAAEFVKLANTFPSKVLINGKDSKSLLGIMSLGLIRGTTATLTTDDQEGKPALDSLAALIESGFGEA